MFAFLLSLAAVVQHAPPPVAPPIFVPPPVPPMARPSPHDPASVMRLFSAADYPSEAMRLEQQGTVAYRATVGADGRVVGCEVMDSSGSASLDAATCSIIQRRARFRPARDQHGRPTEDKFSGRVRWVLPKLEPTAFADQRNFAIFTISGAGQVSSCRLEGADAGPAAARFCPTLTQVAQKVVTSTQRAMAQAGQELVLEQGLLIGGPDAANFIGQASGEQLIKRVVFVLTIDGLGKVIDCVPLGFGADVGHAANGCAFDRKRGFSPLGPAANNQADRHAVRYFVTYLRPQR